MKGELQRPPQILSTTFTLFGLQKLETPGPAFLPPMATWPLQLDTDWYANIDLQTTHPFQFSLSHETFPRRLSSPTSPILVP